MKLRTVVLSLPLAFVAFLLGAPTGALAGGGADLTLTVTGPATLEQHSGPTPVSSGDGNYSVTYTNYGPDDATNVVLSVRLGAGVYWDAFDTTFADCSRTDTGATCNLGTVPAGTSVTRTFALYPGTVGTWKTMYSISADQSDNKQNNNTVVMKVAVIPPTHADLWITPSTGSGSATSGQPVLLRGFYGNGGPANATNVVETIALPDGVALVLDQSPGCTQTGQTATCALGDEADGSANQFADFTVVAAQPGQYTIIATISADQPDQNTANNKETIVLQVS